MVTVNKFRYVLPADEYCFGDDLQTTRFFLALLDDATYVQEKKPTYACLCGTLRK